MAKYYIAQVNIAQMKGPLDTPPDGRIRRAAGRNKCRRRFQSGLRLASSSRCGQCDLSCGPNDDDRVLFNLSVWETIEALRAYVYGSAHAEVLRQRREWFDHFAGVYTALWWIPISHIPSVDEAKKRLAHLQVHGPSQFAFGFKSLLEPDESVLETFDWSMFEECEAAAG